MCPHKLHSLSLYDNYVVTLLAVVVWEIAYFSVTVYALINSTMLHSLVWLDHADLVIRPIRFQNSVLQVNKATQTTPFAKTLITDA